MNISEYISYLEKILRDHGDLDVETEDYDLRRVTARCPAVDYRLILKSRETKPRFLGGSFPVDTAGRKGEKVCRI